MALLIDSMLNRVHAVIDAKGGQTKYLPCQGNYITPSAPSFIVHSVDVHSLTGNVVFQPDFNIGLYESFLHV